MKQLNLKELRGRVELVEKEISALDEKIVDILDILAQPDIIIADFPPIEKKVRKKRVRKVEHYKMASISGDPEPLPTITMPVEPKRGRRGRKSLFPFGEPKLREGETPIK